MMSERRIAELEKVAEAAKSHSEVTTSIVGQHLAEAMREIRYLRLGIKCRAEDAMRMAQRLGKMTGASE